MGAELARTRRRVLETARELHALGLVEGTAGNVSARLADGRIVVTPSAVPYDTMRDDDLVVLDPAGVVLSGRRTPTSERAAHLACLARYPELGAVIHTHSTYASMFAVVRQPIPSVLEELDVYVGGDVPVADYHTAGSVDLGEEAARHLCDRGAVLLANHGVLSVGGTLAEALHVARLVERVAHIVVGSRSLGRAIPLPDPARARLRAEYVARRGARSARRVHA